MYTFATPKLQPLITKPEGKNLIQACLNAPDGSEYPAGAYEQDEDADDRQQATNAANLAAMPQNYAAAMAGLAGYQYPTGNQAYMNPAHYPAYAAAQQYNNMAAAYWPQQQMMSQQQQQQHAQGGALNSAGSQMSSNGSPGSHEDHKDKSLSH